MPLTLPAAAAQRNTIAAKFLSFLSSLQRINIVHVSGEEETVTSWDVKAILRKSQVFYFHLSLKSGPIFIEIALSVFVIK